MLKVCLSRHAHIMTIKKVAYVYTIFVIVNKSIFYRSWWEWIVKRTSDISRFKKKKTQEALLYTHTFYKHAARVCCAST